jgi:hypothetical protein
MFRLQAQETMSMLDRLEVWQKLDPYHVTIDIHAYVEGKTTIELFEMYSEDILKGSSFTRGHSCYEQSTLSESPPSTKIVYCSC